MEIPVMREMATNKLEPELIPKIYGPAKALLNKVCIINPQTDRAEPAKQAIIKRGNRNSRTMMCSVLDESKKNQASLKIDQEMEISPAAKWQTKAIGKITNKSRSKNLFCF